MRITYNGPYPRNKIAELEAQNAQLLAALEEMINPPTIMEHDHPFEIASWFVEKAKQALASARPLTSEQRQQVQDIRGEMGEQDNG